MKRLLVFISIYWFVLTTFAGWVAEYSPGTNIKNTATGFAFNFPSGSGHVNLVGKGWGSVPVRSMITIVYRITGSTKFKSLDPAPAPPALKPNFRPMIFNGDWYDNNGRWWPSGANCAWLIADGQTHTYQMQFDPKQWSNVYGKFNGVAFKACLKKMKRLYLAFGGGNSFSHGLTDGGAKFELISVNVK